MNSEKQSNKLKHSKVSPRICLQTCRVRGKQFGSKLGTFLRQPCSGLRGVMEPRYVSTHNEASACEVENATVLNVFSPRCNGMDGDLSVFEALPHLWASGARKDCTSQEACRAQQRKDKFPSLAPVPKWKRLRASQHQRKFMVPISCMKHATSCNLTRRPPANLYLQNQNRLVKACLYFPIPMRFFATSVNPARPKSMCPRQIWGCSCWVRGTASSVPKALKAAQRLPTLLVRWWISPLFLWAGVARLCHQEQQISAEIHC